MSSLESFFIFKNYSNPFFFFRNCAESFGIRLVIRMLTCNARSQSYLDKQRGAFHCSTISTVVERESIKAVRGSREGEPPYPSNLVQSSHGHTLPSLSLSKQLPTCPISCRAASARGRRVAMPADAVRVPSRLHTSFAAGTAKQVVSSPRNWSCLLCPVLGLSTVMQDHAGYTRLPDCHCQLAWGLAT